ncbi:MAG TPA: type VI secretion system tube protein TssD [Chitinophagaceae bacterium]|nr:type VI secretion system tube protein TssD [Chitinophagaceae bacterium]
MPATSVFLQLTAQKIGEIKGPVRMSGRDNSIKLIAIKHEIISPRDITTGLSTGKRQHHPFIITKEVDKTTPILNQILVENLSISLATLIFFGTDTGSFMNPNAEAEVYRIILRNASVSRIELTLPEKADNERTSAVLIESISLSYNQIEWIWKNGGITASDKLNNNA